MTSPTPAEIADLLHSNPDATVADVAALISEYREAFAKRGGKIVWEIDRD